MPISTSTANGNRTVTLTYTAENQKVLDVLTDAGQWEYTVKGLFPVHSEALERNKTWAELTNNEKLLIIEQGVRAAIVNWSKNYYRFTQLPGHETTIITERDAKYGL
jgi:hypothetical protein